MKKLLTIYDTQNPDVVFQRKGYPPLDPAKQTATNIKGTAAKKKFKGENIEKTNFMLGTRADCYKNSIRAER